MDNWLSSISQFFVDLVKSFFGALFDFLHDIAITTLDLLLSGVVSVLSLIPAPSFLANSNINTFLGNLPAFALWGIGQLNLPAAFGILLSGFLFRMARKLLTLGQW